jgi:tRNA wybutosine-synthesizing protein 4
MLDKRAMIQRCTELCDLIPDADFLPYAGSVAVRAERYLGIGCDLADIQGLDSALRSEVDIAQSSILCFAEVSLTYMPVKAADALIGWASTLADGMCSFEN